MKSILGTFKEIVGGDPTKWQMADIVSFINWIATFILGFAGIIAVIYLIVGGYTYMTSLGNPEAIMKAKSMILWSLVGLLLIVSAWVIIRFVLQSLGVSS